PRDREPLRIHELQREGVDVGGRPREGAATRHPTEGHNMDKGTEQTPLPVEEPGAIKVRRDGDRDLAFQGWLLGEGEHGDALGDSTNFARGTEVRIYLTIGRKIVTTVRQWTRGR